MAIFGVCFAPCAGEKDNLAAPSWRLGEHEKIGWIAMWSLIVYVFHWALWDCVNILLPGSDKNYRAQTLMAISLLALALPFHLSWQKYKVLGEDFEADGHRASLIKTTTRLDSTKTINPHPGDGWEDYDVTAEMIDDSII